MSRAILILQRELKEIRLNKTFFQTMAALPVILVLLPTALIFFYYFTLTEFASQNTSTLTGDCAQLAGFNACNKADIFGSLLNICFSFFLPVPIVLPMTIAAYSLVGEKERKSLEPLLSTAVTTREILVGKALTAIVPTVILNWVSFGLLLLILRLILPADILSKTDFGLWITLILIWTPLLATVSTLVGITISARARDVRAAQQSGSIMALPIVALVIGNAFGFFSLNWYILGAGAVVLLVLAVLSFVFAERMFERETILTRWK